jgi:hypothetical protein
MKLRLAGQTTSTCVERGHGTGAIVDVKSLLHSCALLRPDFNSFAQSHWHDVKAKLRRHRASRRVKGCEISVPVQTERRSWELEFRGGALVGVP